MSVAPTSYDGAGARERAALPEATTLVLASASPARAATLRAAGIEPTILVSSVDEDAVLASLHAHGPAVGAGAPSPAEQVTALARAKAEAVAQTLLTPTGRGFPTSRRYVVVGCDSMLEFQGEMLGKPHTPEVAFQRIRELQGNEATLWTGHHLILLDARGQAPSDARSRAASTIIRMGAMTDEEIRAYVDSGEPLEVAGSFTIDGLGGAFIDGVVGDPHSVVGISLPLLRGLASELGIFWPSLWNRYDTSDTPKGRV